MTSESVDDFGEELQKQAELTAGEMTRNGQGALERLANLNADRITQDSQRAQQAE